MICVCVCVCMSGVWTHDKTLNDESLWWSCELYKKQVVSCSVLSIELQSWVPYVHLSKIPTDTTSVKIYYTDHLKQHRWKRSLKYYPVEVLWRQVGKRGRNMDPQKGPKFLNRLRRVKVCATICRATNSHVSRIETSNKVSWCKVQTRWQGGGGPSFRALLQFFKNSCAAHQKPWLRGSN